MADVLILIKSGNSIHDGSIVTLVSSKLGITTVKGPQVGGGMYASGCVIPSGVGGATDDGYLAGRYHKPTYGYTG